MAESAHEMFWDPMYHMSDVLTPQCLRRVKRSVFHPFRHVCEVDVCTGTNSSLSMKDSDEKGFSYPPGADLSRESSDRKAAAFQDMSDKEIKSFYEDPPPNIYIVGDDKDLSVVHALIVGAQDTPYEGGFFYFVLKFPGSYPLTPPWVKFMTTDGGNVRMNPNLYKNGKVCLSILGTWDGPGWSPANSLSSCLISIQSLLGEKPYHNEPGCENERYEGDSKKYNRVIQHETLRVAVCGMLENETGISIPESFVEIMEKTFLEHYNFYVGVAVKHLDLTKQKMEDPFGEKRGYFQYESLLLRLAECKKKIQAKLNNHVKDSAAENTSSSTSASDLDDPSSHSSDNSLKK